MRVLVNSPFLAAEGMAILEAAGLEVHTMEAFPSPARMAEEAGRLRVHAIIGRQGRFTAAVMDASPDLRIIARHGTGTDDIDLAAAEARGLMVTRAPGANALAVAEHTIALVLALLKGIPGAGMAAGAWRPGDMRMRDIAGTRLGLFGMGAIGRQTARLAQALGMEVLAHSRQTDPAVYAHARPLPSLDALLVESEVLSLHTALTPATRHVINAATLARLPTGAYLVNTARGGLVEDAALVAALDSGHLAGAGIDVTEPEPPAADHPFRHHPRILLTPHVGGVTHASLAQMAIQAAECVVARLTGDTVPPERIVVAGA
ncbi:NAD(P)-dependent oxidoreductase [Acidisoma sp. 7E03]